MSSALEREKADVMTHATSSCMKNVHPQPIEPREVASGRQVAKGILAGQELVVLDLRMYLGAPNPHDSILIDGTPSVDMTIRGGVQGDRATPAIIVNSIPKIKALRSGLRTMPHLPPIPPCQSFDDEDRSVMLKTF